VTAEGTAPPAAAPQVLTDGRLVAGRYRLLDPLGVGGMGTVWRAEDELLGRPVAVKEVVFPPGLSPDERDVHRERTRREARAAARLDHPSAVTVFDVVEQDGHPFLVLELVEGRTLSEVVRVDGPLSVQRTAQVGLALLGALQAAHAQAILHRDVKPGNVLIGPARGSEPARVVLTDFGIAASAGDPSITSTGLLLGSPAYIAPERARGRAPGPASDLWSLGATLFTAVEGRPPYERGDPVRTVTAVVTGEHEPYIAAGPLVEVLEGLLAREPAERLSAARARELLLPIARGTAPDSTAAAAPRPAAPVRDEPTTALSAAALLEDAFAASADRAADAEGSAKAKARPRGPDDAPRRRAGGSRRIGAGTGRAPLLVLMLLVIAVASVAVYVVAGDQVRLRVGELAVGAPRAGPGSSPAAQAPDPLPTLPVGALPAGWDRYTDDSDGWRIGVPPGYVRSPRKGMIQLREPERRYTLRVDVVPPREGALDSTRRFAAAVSNSLRDYRELRLAPVEGTGTDTAELSFTYTDEGTDLRVLQRTVVPSGGPAYRLYWQTNDKDFTASLPVFEQIATTFRPAPAKAG